MSTDTSLRIRDLDVEVVRKPIKNLHVGVYPPAGHVRVAAPEHMDDDAIRLAVIDRLGWIRRQRDELRSQPRQSQREMVNGESHYVWGRRYRLQVEEHEDARPSVEFGKGNTLRLLVKPGADRDGREAVLTEWYRDELRREAAPRVDEWSGELGVKIDEWRIRRMRTKWGTCNADAKRIWLNLELAKKRPTCLDYIIVHEMLHLKERTHTERFERLLDDAMPKWRAHRDELYRLPLGYEEWPERGRTREASVNDARGE